MGSACKEVKEGGTSLCSGCSLMVVLSALGCGVNSAIGSEVVGFGIVVSIGDDIDFLARFDVYNIALAPLAFFAEM